MNNHQDLRYPLSWPVGVPRSKRLGSSKFSRLRSFAQARDALLHELALLGAREIVLSTNLDLRMDGLPRSGQARPSDPGVCVYFKLDGRLYAMPCDKWNTVEDNAYAIAKHVEAMRGQRRWGVGSTEQAFRGFAALPPARTMGRWSSWDDCFGVTAAGNMTTDQRRDHVKRRHAAMLVELRATHPAGDHPDEPELNALRDAAMRELGA